MRVRTLARMSRADFRDVVVAVTSGPPLARPRTPTMLARCAGTPAQRAFCEREAYAFRVGRSWCCAMGAKAHEGDYPPPTEWVRTPGEDGTMHAVCAHRRDGYRPGPSIPVPGDAVRLDRYDPDAVAWVRRRVHELADEDSPIGRVAYGVMTDDFAAIDAVLDVRWLHRMHRMTPDERANLWRSEAQLRLAAHLQHMARHPRFAFPCANARLAFA